MSTVLSLLVLLPFAPQEPAAPALMPLPMADVQLTGWLGERVRANREQWLAHADLEARLAPFERRPAHQAWAGEHFAKWLCAASLAAAAPADPAAAALRERIDGAVARFLATQGDDGYLGAYLPSQRFALLPGADWDVWTAKYGMLGLLAHHDRTGDEATLRACRRAADLLLATFGEGGRDILSAGTHVGMAATSVLEPIARLHRRTGAERYLAFARRLVAAWDAPGGPRIATALTSHGRLARTANAKAYELLSNLLGLCELHRATGEHALLRPVLAAFEDAVANELLPTGSMSNHERFVGGGRIPSGTSASVAENCVTVTWLQLCHELLQLTGEARFGREVERTAYNHLLAAQRADGRAFSYFTPLRGAKDFDEAITCCSSSGARGIALLPQCAVFATTDELVVNLLESCRGTATLGDRRVSFDLQSEVPRTGGVRLTFGGDLPAMFGVRFRLSEWAVPALLRSADEEEPRTIAEPGWVTVPARTWRDGDAIDLTVRCRLQRALDPHDDLRTQLGWGPCVLALPTANVPRGETDPFQASFFQPRLQPGPGLAVEIDLAVDMIRATRASLVPFADVGADGGRYRVWLPSGIESTLPVVGSARSRPGNVNGSITDGDADSFAVTFDGTRRDEDWYAITFVEPQQFARVVFAHGHAFHDGGWFDAAQGAPRVQIRSKAGAEWQTIGTLPGYPATTATDRASLVDGQRFVLRLDAPVQAIELRVVGAPACGDAPAQAFSSCSELAALR